MGRRRVRGRDVNGILLLDKPSGITSNDALQQVKRLFFAKKAGHTGSLDPLASGIRLPPGCCRSAWVRPPRCRHFCWTPTSATRCVVSWA